MKKKEDTKDEKKIASNLKCHWSSCENKMYFKIKNLQNFNYFKK